LNFSKPFASYHKSEFRAAFKSQGFDLHFSQFCKKNITDARSLVLWSSKEEEMKGEH